MAITGENESEAVSRVRQVTAELSTESRFPVPVSDGYSVYSSLLSLLSSVDEDVGASVHDSALGSLHCSGLLGTFGDSDRPHHKTVLGNRTYELSLGIVHPEDSEVFQALVNALVLEGEMLELSHGELRVDRFESENETYEELLARANELDDPAIEMTFETTTCIQEAGGVTTAFPHRSSVFSSLRDKWNRSAPAEIEVDLSREEIEANLIEKPDTQRFRTHSVLVNRVQNDNGENRNIFRQGFTGACTYEFKNASESIENAITALALFGEYSGVGSAVARGCGSITVEVEG